MEGLQRVSDGCKVAHGRLEEEVRKAEEKKRTKTLSATAATITSAEADDKGWR